jgi:pimeloyl-ACP methyl ester carboxylesterase
VRWKGRFVAAFAGGGGFATLIRFCEEEALPNASVNGINIYYERHGEGEPLLFIAGLGANITEIPYLIDSYSRHVEMIVFDARGCGRSDKPEGDYSMGGFADDAAALLEGLGIGSAFVYGSSMGGMVAQELTLRHPAKVRALILGCTTGGAIRGVRPTQDTVERMVRNQSLAGDEALEAGWALGYSADYIAENREALLERSRNASRYAAPRDSYMRQVIAAAQHDTWDHLGTIACPVMIIHGSDDLMMPAGNAHLMKERMPDAELHILEGMGHGYNLEAQAQADGLVIEFIARHARRSESMPSAVR